MQSYPFTSQVTYDEQDMPIYDRAVDSAFLRQFQAQYYENGIFYKPTSAFQVRAGSGMEVLVNPGACQIQGAFGIETAQRTLALKAASTNDRIDTVVLRLDLSLSVRSIDLYILTGTEAASPKAPALTRNSTVWELGIANILILKNTTSVSQQRITDTRLDNSRCGVVAQTIGKLDTTPYFEQVQAMIEEMEKTIKGIEGGSGFVFSVNGQSGHVTNIATTGSDGKLSSDEVPSANSMQLWNLGAAESIPSGADLNSYSTPGTYLSPSATVSGNIQNTPWTASGYKLIVQTNQNANYLCQIAYTGTAMKLRRSNAGEWSDWVQIHMDGGSNFYTAKNQSFPNGNYGFNFNNSDVIGFNGIYFNDPADGGPEGLNFPKSGIDINSPGYVFNSNDFYTLRIDANGELKLNNQFVPSYTAHIGKTLWSGNWSSGKITIPNANRYRILLLSTKNKSDGGSNATLIMACNYSTWLRGMGGYSTNTPTTTNYYFNAQSDSTTSETFNFIECIAQKNDGTSTSDLIVTNIIGMV